MNLTETHLIPISFFKSLEMSHKKFVSSSISWIVSCVEFHTIIIESLIYNSTGWRASMTPCLMDICPSLKDGTSQKLISHFSISKNVIPISSFFFAIFSVFSQHFIHMWHSVLLYIIKWTHNRHFKFLAWTSKGIEWAVNLPWYAVTWQNAFITAVSVRWFIWDMNSVFLDTFYLFLYSLNYGK
jgi:hypothetical protein